MSVPFKVGGWAKLSTCDWPSRLVSTVFAQGCPWQCLYCHNPDLIDPQATGSYNWQEIIDFMKSRQGLLDGIVFSGGEPTRQPSLVSAAAQIKDEGFEVGVHTSGVYPTRIRSLIAAQAVDWVGLDIKTALHKYEPVVQSVVNPDKIMQTWNLLLEFGVDFEIRTTIHPDYITAEDIDSIVELLCQQGRDQWVVQKARSEGTHKQWVWSDTSLVDYCRRRAQENDIMLTER